MTPMVVATRVSSSELQEVLSPSALVFIAKLVERFEPRRLELLARRAVAGAPAADLELPPEWSCSPPPPILRRRRVELVGPASELALRTAIQYRPNAFVADLDDATSHSWSTLLDAQRQLYAANHGFMAEKPPPIVVRPRALDLEEQNLTVDDLPASATLVDVGLYAFHNAHHLVTSGAGPFFSLTKLHSHEEAIFWNDVLGYLEQAFGLAPYTCRASIRIDTMQAAVDAEKLVWALRHRIVGIACGREELIRDLITQRADAPDNGVTPDRRYLTIDRPPLLATARRLVRIGRAHGVPVIGPLSREVPFDSDHDVARGVYTRTCLDAARAALAGFDGTRVVHGVLVPVARAAFAVASRGPRRPQASERFMRPEDLALLHEFEPTEGTVRDTLRMCLLQLEASLGGRARVALRTFVEDASSARAARAQLWEWVRRGILLEDRTRLDAERLTSLCEEEAARVGSPGYVRALLRHTCGATTRDAFAAAETLLLRCAGELPPDAVS